MNVYCLFCQTQRAHIVASTLEARGIHRAFTPQIVKHQRVQGQNQEKQYNLLPGYVFVYDEEEPDFFRILKGVTGMIRRLGRPEDHFCLKGTDLDFAMRLYEKDGVVGKIPVFKEGETIRIADDLFKGCSGIITRMDYKKQRACVKFKFAGTDCTTWIACELIEKAQG